MSPRALLILGWHFWKHLLKKVTFTYRRGGRERFEQNYLPEGLRPLSPPDAIALAAWQQCIGCGLCDALCPAAPIIPNGRYAVGPELMASAGLRDLSTLEDIAPDALSLHECGGCKACEDACPTRVPIRDLVNFLAHGGTATSVVDRSPRLSS